MNNTGLPANAIHLLGESHTQPLTQLTNKSSNTQMSCQQGLQICHELCKLHKTADNILA